MHVAEAYDWNGDEAPSRYMADSANDLREGGFIKFLLLGAILFQ